MSQESTGKQVAVGVGVAIAAYILWDGWLKKYWFDWLDDGLFNQSADGTGGSGSSWGTGGAGTGAGSGGAGGGGAGGAGTGTGSGGAGGAGGSGGVNDFTSLAAAIYALAAGVQLPNIQSASLTCAALTTTPLVPAEGGKRICVLAYAVFATGTANVSWRDGNATVDLWKAALAAPAGNSGANMATSWPGYIFATSPSNALSIYTDASAVCSVTYWKEDA